MPLALLPTPVQAAAPFLPTYHPGELALAQPTGGPRPVTRWCWGSPRSSWPASPCSPTAGCACDRRDEQMSTDMIERPTAIPAALIGLAPLAARIPAALRVLTTAHAALLLRTDGRLLGRWFGIPVLVLETVGRRSGRPRTTPLVYLRDGHDLVVVAANGGSPHDPGWWLNLRSAGRAVAVLGRHRVHVQPRETTGTERERLWRRFAARVPVEAYQRRTARRLPIVVLTPVDTLPEVTTSRSRPMSGVRVAFVSPWPVGHGSSPGP